MEITINYSDEQFYSEELETLILRVLSKGAELQNVAEDAELSLLICDADTIHELNKTYADGCPFLCFKRGRRRGRYGGRKSVGRHHY